MKRTSIAAAALLLSTAAYAAIPSTEPSGVVVEKDPYAVTATSAVENADAGGTAMLHNASADSWNSEWAAAEPVAYTADAAALKQAADDKAEAADAAAKTDAIETAEAEGADVADEADDTDVVAEPTAMDTEATPVEDAAATGVGGPYEAAEPVADRLGPSAAGQNYPACRPGPGDDRCIQLYEPGVREQLASWTQPTGGYAGDATQVAMGGPYEPVEAADESGEQTAMNGNGSVETAIGETAEDEELAGI